MLKRSAEERSSKYKVDQAIQERSFYREKFDAVQENGIIAVIREGMDCDCTQYYQVMHIPVPSNLFVFVKAEEERMNWLDGPESVYYGKPSEYPIEHLQSDRALAAYEDGHMSHVTWADRSEMSKV